MTESGYRKRSNCTLHVNFTSGRRKMENEISISKCYIIYRFLYWTVSVMASTSRKDQQTSGSLRTHPRTKWWWVFVFLSMEFSICFWWWMKNSTYFCWWMKYLISGEFHKIQAKRALLAKIIASGKTAHTYARENNLPKGFFQIWNSKFHTLWNSDEMRLRFLPQ